MLSAFKNLLYRIDKELKGRQSLLTVHDYSPLYRPGRELELLKYHRTHEVCFGTIAFQDRLCEVCYIVPQGLPLFILIPHVATLEVRDFVANWVSK